MKDTESRQKTRDENGHRKAGIKGLAEGFHLPMLHVTTTMKASTDNIGEDTILRCWLKSQILPAGAHGEPKAGFKK